MKHEVFDTGFRFVQEEQDCCLPHLLNAVLTHCEHLQVPIKLWGRLIYSMIGWIGWAEKNWLDEIVDDPGTPMERMENILLLAVPEYILLNSEERATICSATNTEVILETPSGVTVTIRKEGNNRISVEINFGQRAVFLALQMAGAIMRFNSELGIELARMAIKNYDELQQEQSLYLATEKYLKSTEGS